jgi:N-methylhydantoinase A
MSSYRIGIDVGGTFTDIVCLESGRLTTKKLPSTPGDFSVATIEGVKRMLAEEGCKGFDIAELIHGTTVATNAILEKTGARVGLITTQGFRDVLEIGRIRMPKLYDLEWQKPKALVERRLILEVTERVSSTGEVLTPLNVEEGQMVLERLLSLGVESLVVCFINSFVNPVNEQEMGKLISSRSPALSVSLSSEVLPEIREFERMGSTVINAYVKPVVSVYLKTLEKELRSLDINVPLLIMQSGGGLMSSSLAREKPVNMIESGPAAGVMGSAYLSKQTARRNIISFDMGGTTAKASTIENDEVSRTSEYEVGGEMSMGHHMQKGSGYLLRVPSIELAEVGSGGGSIAWIDQGGALRVGPRSAAASPGPACYGIGGTEPTVTDANVVLGYLNPNFLVGGELSLDASQAHRSVEENIATPLGIRVEEAAYNIHLIANATMIRAIRAVTSEKGRDPGDFTLFAFGGNGPVHGVGIAQELNIQEVLVPPAAGVFGSVGLLSADVEHHYVQTYCCDAEGMNIKEANHKLGNLKKEGLNDLTVEGYPRDRIQFLKFVDMRYAGQNFELTIPLMDEEFTPQVVEQLREAFSREHEETFGYRSDEHIWLVNLRLVARGLPLEPRMPPSILVHEKHPDGQGRRQAYFGSQNSWLDTPVLSRDTLKVNSHDGPIIVEEYNSTTVIPPGAVVSIDSWGNIVIKVGDR